MQKVKGIQSVQVEGEANGEVTFTANSASGEDLRAAVSQALSAAGCAVLNLTAETRSLEDIFLKLTEKPEEPAAAPDQDPAGKEE